MKKFILILILAFAFYSCDDSDSCGPETGEIPENNITDLTFEQISKNPLGGDPRGIFFANNPLLVMFSTDTTKTVIDSLVKSEGNLMYEFTGDSETEGNFTLIEDYFDIEVYLIWKNQYGQSDISYRQQLNNDPPAKMSGKWKVEDEVLIMESCDDETAVRFTANSNGLFLINDYYDVTVGNYRTIMSYKRKN